ncbi:TetR family transcriptional regulator [Quadrisphaera sp. KR29]|uniref:TetR family transcriptional regulator n=1 Tax=Quadrisphaera sp. KR29 TaxID=3461391 RepID=UPI00404427CA
MRDGDASRRRLLDAAAAEFAEHGFAGARVDRIAASSGVNKQQMYAWHGSKDGLFDAVFDDQLQHIVDVVPFDADDLPGYAVRLYDSYLREPELIRLTSWNRLERVPTGDLLRGHRHLADPKLEAIAAAQAAGRVVADLRPAEVYSMVIALAGTWSPVSGTLAASAADDDAEHDRRREALRLTVRRALVP